MRFSSEIVIIHKIILMRLCLLLAFLFFIYLVIRPEYSSDSDEGLRSKEIPRKLLFAPPLPTFQSLCNVYGIETT